jgi:sugar/nucleoside kinase (ribokinase family)
MRHEARFDMVVAGHICFDVIPTFPTLAAQDYSQVFIPGKLIEVGRVAVSTGGPVSNTGLALKRLGMKVALIGKVGEDFFGEAILARLKLQGIEQGMRRASGEQSSYTIVISPPGMDRMFLHCPGANSSFGVADVDFALVEQAKLFHLGYPPLMERLYRNDGKALAEIFRRVKELGVTTSLDMALPDANAPAGQVNWTPILEATVPYVDMFLPSAEETLFMLAREEFLRKKARAGARDMLDFFSAQEISGLAAQLLQYGAKIVCIKCGYKGLYLRTSSRGALEHIGTIKPKPPEEWADRELWEPSFKVERIASATGSGDSAIAGFLAAYVRGEGVETCLRYGCAVGAENIMELDAVSGVRSWEETTELIRSGWKKNPLQLPEPEWRFDKQGQLWYGPSDARR